MQSQPDERKGAHIMTITKDEFNAYERVGDWAWSTCSMCEQSDTHGTDQSRRSLQS